MNPLYLLLELAVAISFVLAAGAALRRGRLPFYELLSAAVFGILLEEGDQLIFQSYHYSADWLAVIDRAPVAIGLTWALILAGAMRITDALGVRRRYAPFVDAVLAISLDLAFDAIAIRMGLWTWRGIGPEQAWFGVPAGNFYAWLFVAVGFSLVSRWLREAVARGSAHDWLQLLVPIPAYLILIAGLVPFIILQPLLEPGKGHGLGIFAATLVIFAGIAAYGVWGPNRVPPDGARDAIVDLRLAFASRLAIHAVFITAFFVMGLQSTVPTLLVIALLLLAAEIPLAWLVNTRLRTDADAAQPVREHATA
ncbi:MAG TPA: carotenoid biosynthesis protein [Candidatus Limnocylindria bacterium]|jgi:hypothetical protein|nr:carotenoid biosynthesis protein [Candidatus Limnocylindria bacterium]